MSHFLADGAGPGFVQWHGLINRASLLLHSISESATTGNIIIIIIIK